MTLVPIEVPAAGAYRLDPAGSRVSFTMGHLFGLGRVAGTVPVTEGRLVIDPDRDQASGTVFLDARSFSSGLPRRDQDVRSPKFLDVERYPQVTFRAGSLNRGSGAWTLDGDLIVRNRARPVVLAVESVEPSGDGFTARATTRIDRYLFGLTAARGMAARWLDLTVTAVAVPG